MMNTLINLNEGTLPAVNNSTPLPTVNRGYSYSYISTQTTTQVKSGAGFLHSITVNATAAGAIDLIDGVSGTTANIGQLKASVVEGTYIYDIEFTTGLKIITNAGSNITVSYK